MSRLDPIFWWTLGCGVLVAAVFLTVPQIDPAVTAFFYRGAQGFPWSYRPPTSYLSESVRLFTATISVVLLALLGWRLLLPIGPGPSRRAIIYLIAVMAIGPGLVANAIFKDQWGRARPSQTVEFGGNRKFTPPLVITIQCARNCSFVSGDASVGFALVGLAYAFPARRRRLFALGLAAGAGIGFVRIGQGGHYLSDVIFSGLFMILVAVALAALILRPKDG
jgi:lipid A 4'-phosphatase